MEVKELKTRPTLRDEHRWLYEAYHNLSRSRQVGGMGEFYIPLTEFEAYLNIISLSDTEQRLFLLNVISSVDAVLLHERYEELKNTTKK